MGEGGKIIATFVLSLFLTSVLIGYFNQEFNGDNSVNTITLPSSMASYYGAQNYITGSYNTSITEIIGLFNNWVYYPNIGMVHTTVGLLNTNDFLIDNIQPSSNGRITNYYVINNSVKKDYTIILRYTGSYDSNEIIVKQDGLHIPKYFQAFGVIIGDNYFISIPNANQYTDVTIKTDYYNGDKDNAPSGSITFNNQVYQLQNLNKIAGVISFKTYYGGISSSALGTTFVSFRSDNVIVTSTTASVTDALARTGSFIAFAFSLLTFSLPAHIMHPFVQILIILPQEFMILVGIAIFAREG